MSAKSAVLTTIHKRRIKRDAGGRKQQIGQVGSQASCECRSSKNRRLEKDLANLNLQAEAYSHWLKWKTTNAIKEGVASAHYLSEAKMKNTVLRWEQMVWKENLKITPQNNKKSAGNEHHSLGKSKKI